VGGLHRRASHIDTLSDCRLLPPFTRRRSGVSRSKKCSYSNKTDGMLAVYVPDLGNCRVGFFGSCLNRCLRRTRAPNLVTIAGAARPRCEMQAQCTVYGLIVDP
jgi:hypothetical protein